MRTVKTDQNELMLMLVGHGQIIVLFSCRGSYSKATIGRSLAMSSLEASARNIWGNGGLSLDVLK